METGKLFRATLKFDNDVIIKLGRVARSTSTLLTDKTLQHHISIKFISVWEMDLVYVVTIGGMGAR